MMPSSPLLDQYNRDGIVTPGLQKALDMTRAKLGAAFQFHPAAQDAPSAAPAPGPSLAPPGPAVPQIQRAAAPAAAPGIAAEGGAMPQPAAPMPGVPAIPRPTDHQQELTRLTTGDTGKSGIEQIHNPWIRTPLRVLDAVGSAFAPRLMQFTPGTQLHHQMLVNHQAANVNEDEKLANDTANREHLGAETAELPARAEHERAQAEALRNPPEKADKAEAKTVTTDQGVMQWNPETQRYDIKVGDAKAGKETGTVHQLDDGTLIMAHPDGSATPITINGQPAKGHVAEKAPNQYGDFKTDYLKKHPTADAAEIQKAFERTKQAPERPPHALMIDPTTHRAIEVAPGSTVPDGAMTPGGVNSTNVPTAQTRSMAEAAPKVLNFVNRIEKMVDQQAATLGPAASRWNEFMAGKVGAPNPEFTKLRTDIGLLTTALMRMHVGARGGEQMMEHFHNLIDLSKQSPENLKAALAEIRDYANVVGHGAGHTEQPAAGGQAPITGTINGKKMRYKGSGDSTDIKNWEEIK